MQTETSFFWLVIVAGFGAFLSFINIVVLLLTMRSVKQYTEEAGKMSQTLAKQAEQKVYQAELPTKMYNAALKQAEELTRLRRLSVLPVLAARLQPDQSGNPVHNLFLKNIGPGIAINVEIARLDFNFPHDDKQSNSMDVAERILDGKNGFSVFQPIQSLSQNVEQAVKSFNHLDPDRVGEVIRHYGYNGLDFLSLIDEATPLQIDFQDIEGNRYHQVITRKGAIFVSGPVKLVDDDDLC
jgi:hypothetical protein